jgi:hypothetical protein
MPAPEPDDFQQLQLLFTDPIQHDYEVIRTVVLYAETLTQRAAETGVDRSTIGDKARRFLEEGMFGLADQRAGKPHPFPERIAGYLLYADGAGKACGADGYWGACNLPVPWGFYWEMQGSVKIVRHNRRSRRPWRLMEAQSALLRPADTASSPRQRT